VLQPEKMKDPAFVEQLRSYHANLQVVVAFRMLPEVVWAMPEYGTFNVHAPLLPQYRGAAPINWAIINGETETGVTTFFLDHDIDTGRIILQKPFAIPDDADMEYVYDGLMHLGAQLCLETLDAIIAADGHPESIPQDTVSDGSAVSTAPKIFKETCEIDWTKTAKQVYDFVRGLSPVPGAWTTLVSPDGKETVLKVYKTRKTGRKGQGSGVLSVVDRTLCISAADDCLEIVELQLAGKKRMAARDFLNGMKYLEMYHVKKCAS
jgi:methionyl-tRNA formyltransferase